MITLEDKGAIHLKWKQNRLELLKLNNIKIEDSFWNRYIKLVTEVIIPYQWSIMNDQIPDIETSHCIENFRIAAKESEGEFYGMVFQDTDLAKWLEAVAYSLSYEKNRELEEQFDEIVDLIKKAQWEDGYINTYYTIKAPNERWTNLREGHELYTAGHFIEAAVAYYKVTGKSEFLSVVCKFADLICEVFSKEEYLEAYPGHQEVELALVKLFEVTGELNYFNLAMSFINRRGVGENYFQKEAMRPYYRSIFPEFKDYLPLYSQSHLPVREQKTAEGHAVRATYMYCAMADLAAISQDEELFNACENLWENITTKRMYITGGIGSSGLLERFTTDYDLPNDDNYAETCASIGLALFGRRMGQIKKEAKYFDIIEKALYNTVLAGVGMDGKGFFYVNPLEVWPENCLPRTSKEHVKAVRQPWYGVACCPPNVSRTLASLGEYIYTMDEMNRILYINLFISNESSFTMDGKTFEIKLSANYPYDEKILVEVKGEEYFEGTIAIRIPGYVEEYYCVVNDKEEKVSHKKDGYLYLKGNLSKQSIEMKMGMAARLMYSNEKIRGNIGKVAIMKGPLVYCLEEVDHDKNLGSIYLDTNSKLSEYYDENLLGGTTVICAKGKKAIESEELYSTEAPKYEEIDIKAIPYGYWGNRRTGEMLVWINKK